MQNIEERTPAGSEPINPLAVEDPVGQGTEAGVSEAAAPAAAEVKAETKPDDSAARIESMLKASQSMIGKQAGEIGALRAKLEEMTKPTPGPSEDEALASLYQKMDSGEIEIAEGMRQALAINSNQTAARVMSQLSQQQRQGEVAKIQEKFLQENPDYEALLRSGALKPYLDADPLADEYTAFHKYKADERIKTIQTENEAKVIAAKEEGARLAKGADAAGKVLGKQGSTTAAPQVTRPFKNNQEATGAMMATLQRIRSASPQ